MHDDTQKFCHDPGRVTPCPQPCEVCAEECGWSGAQCDVDPDNCWIDDATGEHVNAWTAKRTEKHPETE